MSKQSRRTFVQQAGAVAVAPFISTSVTRALAKASEKKLGYALCGLGFLSEGQIAPAFKTAKNSRLAGVVTDSPAKAQQWQSKYGIPAKNCYSYDTMERMADNRDIDVVYIVTPNTLHGEQARKAAQAGKHVFCEKPMEVTLERCQQMVDVCKQAKVKLAVAYRCQLEANNLECIRLAREKEFGALRIIEASACDNKPDTTAWRYKRALAGGGALMDLGVYALQATRYLTGEEPILVSAVETKPDPARQIDVEVSVAWTAKFPSGVLAYCSTSFEAGPIGRFRGIADHGWFELEPAYQFSGIHGRRSDGKLINLSNGNQWTNQMDAFSRCVIDDLEIPKSLSPEECMRDVRIILAIYESMKSGDAVKLEWT